MHPLDPYVHAWSGTAHDLLDLLPTLEHVDWSRPTDCPDWDVRQVAAHLAHLEAVLAGHDTGDPMKGDGDQVASSYTQSGVDARSDRSPQDLIGEFRRAVEARAAQLAELPDDPSTPAPISPGNSGWSWEVALRNRCVDLWVHEQDIRRAVGRPGGLDTGGAQVTAHTFAAGMPYVLGKRVAPATGTSVVWEVTGGVPMQIGAVIGDDGRASAEVAADPTVTITLSSEALCVLGAGRRPGDAVEAEISGDEPLGRSVLGAMALTR